MEVVIMVAASKETKLFNYWRKWNSAPHRFFNKPLTKNKNYQFSNFGRAYRSWFVPYVKSRIRSHEFRPLLSFLYTDLWQRMPSNGFNPWGVGYWRIWAVNLWCAKTLL